MDRNDSTITESIPRNCDSELQNLPSEINDWTIQNKMKLNVSKELIIDSTKIDSCFYLWKLEAFWLRE